LTSTGTW